MTTGGTNDQGNIAPTEFTSEDEARAYQFRQDVEMWANSRKDVELPNGDIISRQVLDAMTYEDRVAFLENVMGANPEDIE